MLERGGGRRTVVGRVLEHEVKLEADSGRRCTGIGGTGGGGYLGILLLLFDGEAGPVNDSRESR